MIKKYGTGVMAVFIALAMAAFITPEKTHFAATHVFEFDGTVLGGYSVANVQTPGDWKYVGETSQQALCEDVPDKACRMAVTNAYVNNASNPTALSGIAITASTSSSGNAYVTSITHEDVNVYTNQEADN